MTKMRAAPNEATLTIASIETVPIRVPLGRVYRGSNYQMTHRSTIVTRVHTEEGVLGEAYAGDEDTDLLEIDAIIHDEIAPLLKGQDALATERCADMCLPVTSDILRNRRLGLVARASVDAAIWDAIGKVLGQPLWRLWGGFRRDVPMISIGGYYDSPHTIEEEVEQLIGRGLAGMKFKVGGRSPAEDAERIGRARQAGGDDFVLCADANQGYTVSEAVEFARATEDLDVHWFEEPCRWQNDRRAMNSVRSRSGVAICAGQSELSPSGCLELMDQGCIDFCNFDSSWSGGPTEWRRTAAIAGALDVRMAHHEEPQVASHLLAAIPHGTFVECFEPDRDPIWWNLIANRPPLVDGRICLSDQPGFGWDLDQDYIDKYHVNSA